MTGRTQSSGGDRVGADPDLFRRGLVEDNVALARHLARRFSGPHRVNQDIVQVAMVGLVEAANRFDPAYGVPFAAFATRTILGELKRHRRDTAWNVHVARRVKEVALRLPRAVQALNDELGRSPTTEELANRLGVTVEACLEAMEARTADRQIVADAALAESLAAIVHDPRFATIDDRDLLVRWMGRLNDSERHAVRWYFWDDLSQAEIATRLGVSQMAISRILNRALDRMRGWAVESA